MNKLKTILLVEDSPGDVQLTRQAFREADGPLRFHVAADGMEALSFLRRQGRHFYAPRPDLILLDLNLPRMDGRQVLAKIKQDDHLKAIPTIVLTTAGAEGDVEKIYQLQANCYLTKPVDFDAFEDLVKSVSNFWLMTVRLPPQMRVG
jgi:two-component system, chemotaxis family, response regulator Rcp1